MYLTGDTAEAAGTAGRASGPSAGLYLTEPARGLAGLAFLPLAAPWLATAPRGDGHGVLVVPGFLATDTSTTLLRRFLRRPATTCAAGISGATGDRPKPCWTGCRGRWRRSPGAPAARCRWWAGAWAGFSPGNWRASIPARSARSSRWAARSRCTDPRQSRADGAYRRRRHLHADGTRVPTREQVARPIGVPPRRCTRGGTASCPGRPASSRKRRSTRTSRSAARISASAPIPRRCG